MRSAEASVPTPDQDHPVHRGIDWLAVARTFLMQVAVLLALAVALLSYIEWSSDAAFEDFVAASKATPHTQLHLQSVTPVRAVKGQASCPAKG
jgi:hypothetical protein